jgi:hypothetical protein
MIHYLIFVHISAILKSYTGLQSVFIFDKESFFRLDLEEIKKPSTNVNTISLSRKKKRKEKQYNFLLHSLRIFASSFFLFFSFEFSFFCSFYSGALF